MTDNVALYITPQPRHPEMGSHFLGAIAEVDDVSGVAPLAELLPPNWNGCYSPAFFKIDENFNLTTNVVWEQDFFARNGITHVALLEGPPGDARAEPYFFDGQKIKGNSVVCWYREKTADFMFFHCKRCAVMALQWIVAEQEAWDAHSQQQPQASKTRQ